MKSAGLEILNSLCLDYTDIHWVLFDLTCASSFGAAGCDCRVNASLVLFTRYQSQVKTVVGAAISFLPFTHVQYAEPGVGGGFFYYYGIFSNGMMQTEDTDRCGIFINKNKWFLGQISLYLS